jgi:hypothetical protein
MARAVRPRASVVQLAVGEQAGIGGDPGTPELDLDPAVEGDPERRLFDFTRRVRHPETRFAASVAMRSIYESAAEVIKVMPHPGNAGHRR